MVRCSSPRILPTSGTGHSYKIADEIWLDGVGHYCVFGPIRKYVVWEKNCRNLCQKCKESMNMKLCRQIFREK